MNITKGERILPEAFYLIGNSRKFPYEIKNPPAYHGKVRLLSHIMSGTCHGPALRTNAAQEIFNPARTALTPHDGHV